MATYRFDIESRRISTDTSGGAPTAPYVDLTTDTLHLVSGTDIVAMHGGAGLAGIWRGKVIKVPSGAMTGFAWARVNGALSDGATLKLFADGVLIYTTPALTTNDPVRLPAREARAWEVELTSKDRITSLVLADSVETLV